MKYRYERWIGGQIAHITIDWNGSVTITNSTFPHLLGLTYPNLETFEKQYPDYKFIGGGPGLNQGMNHLLIPKPLKIPDWMNIKHDKLNEPIGCEHTFVPYVGIIETFEYCTKCDVKKVS